MACKVIRDDHGTLYRIPSSKFVQTPGGQKLPGFPCIDVWWDREAKPRLNDETLIIRQDNEKGADVITCTLAQAYDLLHAVATAIMRP